ncbi:chitosanase [Streptomyces sp. NPDC060198]|uniref:chitosanase n=1 Tax=Streptomyces sp. NPDC060198 TaxID=3347070 RepID=UPI003646691D
MPHIQAAAAFRSRDASPGPAGRTRPAGVGRRAALPAVAVAAALGLAFPLAPATALADSPHQEVAMRHRAFRPVEAAPAAGLDDPAKKEIAMQLVSSAENSSLEWRDQYKYIEDIGDGRGYTGGIVGFCSGTGDMLGVVQLYTERAPDNLLAPFLPALRAVDGTDSHEGLGSRFTAAWEEAARTDPVFRQVQDDERDRVYFDPAVKQAKADGLGTLGQFAYYDALVMHGEGDDSASFGAIRRRALASARPPSKGGDERVYLDAYLDARVWAMRQEEAHSDTSRVDTAQRVFLRNGNLGLNPPLDWKVYGDSYHIG